MALLGERDASYKRIVTGWAMPSGIDAGLISLQNVPEAPITSTNTVEQEPAYIGPALTAAEIELLKAKFAPLNADNRVIGVPLRDPFTDEIITDARGAGVYIAKRNGREVFTPKTVIESVSRRELSNDGTVVYDVTQRRNW